MKKLLFTLLLAGISAHATTPGGAGSTTSGQIPTCSSINLEAVQPGVKCVTSKGIVYEQVSRDNFGLSWKGPDGLIWSDNLGNGDLPMATNACESRDAKLPSKADFERGEANGFREVLPNIEGHYFWSSSAENVFDNGGFADFKGVCNSFLYVSVRCVSK